MFNYLVHNLLLIRQLPSVEALLFNLKYNVQAFDAILILNSYE